MLPDQWELVKSALETARQLPEAEQSAFLVQACGHDSAALNLAQEILKEQSRSVSFDPPTRQGNVFSPGQLVASRYRILRFIARGGMGQVYEVFDESLAVRVALKTLHSAVNREADSMERFRREIRIALELSHENLCRVHNLVEHKDEIANIVPCLTMELLEGETLHAYAASRRPMDPAGALAIIRQVANAVAVLHERGIIHRDLKTSNIMITPRRNGSLRAVVTDFGLAKSLDSDTELFETILDAQAGAPFFMAPELLSGARPSIASDIYSLGLVIDELVTHSPAFQSDSVATLYYSKLQDGPIPPSRRSRHLPPAWENVILRCIQTNPELRYSSVAEVMDDLSDPSERITLQLQPSPSSRLALTLDRAPKASVAVMPFKDLSPGKDQDHFCDGLTEEIIHLLSQIKGLRVVARTSVFALRNSSHDVREVGRRLGVSNILEGSIRRIGDEIRLMTHFVDATDGSNLFSRRYDRKLTDVFAIQDEIASSIVATLKIEVLDHLTAPAKRADDIAFYSWYLRGLYDFNKQTISSLRAALAHFEQSVSINESFAPAHAGLADCYTTLAWYGALPPAEAMPKAEASALNALRLDSTLAAAHCTLGLVRARFQWNWAAAGEEFGRAMVLNSGLARTHFSYALDYLTPLGRLDESLSELQRALQIDPLSLILQTAIGGCYFRKRQYQRAVELLTATAKLDPSFYHAHWSLARSLEQQGLYSAAVEAYRTALTLTENNTMILAELAHCFGVMQDFSNWQGAHSGLLECARQRYVAPLCFAFVHLGVRDCTKVLTCLEQAVDDRSSMLVWLAVDPRWDVLRPDPAFAKILNQIGLQNIPEKSNANLLA